MSLISPFMGERRVDADHFPCQRQSPRQSDYCPHGINDLIYYGGSINHKSFLSKRDKAKGFWVIGEPAVNISHYYGIIIEINNTNHISITKLQTLFKFIHFPTNIPFLLHDPSRYITVHLACLYF